MVSKRAMDGTWVAYLTSGYDNATGAGVIFEVDASTGVILRKLNAGASLTSPTNQAQLAKINAYFDAFATNNTALALYGGDMNGNLWRWDLQSNTASPVAGQRLGILTDSTGATQPITTRPEVGLVSGSRVVFVGTGRLLNAADITTTSPQSFYAIKDNNQDNGVLRNNAGMTRQTMTVNAAAGVAALSSNPVNWTSGLGWFFDFGAQSGERMNVDPVLALGTLHIIGNVPGGATCAIGGSSWYYQISFTTGTNVPGSPNAGQLTLGGLTVGQNVIKLQSTGAMKNLITDSSGNQTTYAVSFSTTSSSTTRTSWREIIAE